MSTKTVYLPFYIVLTDADTVKTLQAKYPKGVNRAPYNPSVNGTGVPGGAAIEFAAPWVGTSDAGKVAPYTYAPSAAHVGGSQYPVNVATFSQKSGGFFGLFGTTTNFYWLGQFVLASGASDTVGGVAPIPKNLTTRRWVEGFEIPNGGVVGGILSNGLCVTRDAARNVGGYGLAVRGSTSQALINLSRYTAGTITHSWERFYVRLRLLPTTTSFPAIWRCRGSNSPAAGACLAVSPEGALYLFTVDGSSGRTLLAIVGTLPLWDGHVDNDAWVRVDILLHYRGAITTGSAAQAGSIQVFLNGKDATGIKFPPSTTGVDIALGGHISSELGSSFGANDGEFDVDDWINADWPKDIGLNAAGVRTGADTLTGRDWLNGSKIVRVKPKAFSGANVWTGGVQVPLQQLRQTTNGAALTSIVSGAICEVTTDDDNMIDADGTIIGVTAFEVVVQSAAAGLPGSLGYTKNGGAVVNAVLTETGAHAYKSVLFTNDGTSPTCPDVTPLTLRYTKGADVTSASVLSLSAQVETIGIFGTADVRVSETADAVAPTFPGPVGVHNAPYPRSPWAQGTKAGVPAPYAIIAGTYVGNDTGQDLQFNWPVNFFHTRTLAGGGTRDYLWWSSMNDSHAAFAEAIDPAITEAVEDLTFVPVAAPDNVQNRYVVRIAGADAGVNAVGVTYQYIAICDPAARFMLNGQVSHLGSLPQDVANPLINPTFAPEFAFLMKETDASTTTQRLYLQGPGNGAAVISNIGGASTSLALVTSAGVLTTSLALHTIITGDVLSYMLWRRHDGNNDPGEPGVVAILSWTGDDSAARTINIAPASGKRPIFAIGIGQGNKAYLRDPSHTGTNSWDAAGATSTTGITGGGIDSISVGASLNVLGRSYSMIVWFGDATAGNGGFGVNGTFAPVEVAPPVDGPFPPAPDLADVLAQDGTGTGTDAGTIGTPTIPGDITTDLAGTCLAASTGICNLALSRIGVSKLITSLAADNTLEASTLRLHYGIDVEQTLRDFPWPFATRYADLVLVAGDATTSVNSDWQYAYRAPTGMLLARRIVGQQQQKRGPDLDPIDFRVGSDDTGDLIYTDAAIATNQPVTLEYTIRLSCPASAHDPLFRSMLAWRLAASAAPALSRDAAKATYCAQMYERVKIAATAVSANEQQQAADGDVDWISGRS